MLLCFSLSLSLFFLRFYLTHSSEGSVESKFTHSIYLQDEVSYKEPEQDAVV